MVGLTTFGESDTPFAEERERSYPPLPKPRGFEFIDEGAGPDEDVKVLSELRSTYKVAGGTDELTDEGSSRVIRPGTTKPYKSALDEVLRKYGSMQGFVAALEGGGEKKVAQAAPPSEAPAAPAARQSEGVLVTEGPQFDPEGVGYDYATAHAAGVYSATSGENRGHYGSVRESTPEERDRYNLPEESYLVLKGRKHETWDKAVEAENNRGFVIIKRGGRYWSVPRVEQQPRQTIGDVAASKDLPARLPIPDVFGVGDETFQPSVEFGAADQPFEEDASISRGVDFGAADQPFTEPEIGKLASAAGEVGRGAGEMLAAIPKAFAIAETKGKSTLAAAFDAIDRNEAPDMARVAMADWPAVELYRNRPGERQRLRADLGSVAADPRETALYETGQRFTDWVHETIKVNPEFSQRFWLGKVPHGFGSMLGFMVAGLATRGMGVGTLAGAAGTGAMAGAAYGFEDAINSGADLDAAYETSGLNALIGLSEGVPIMRILSRVDKGSGGMVRRAFSNAWKSGTEEAIQEASQQIGEALVASRLVGYDPERNLWRGSGEGAAVGFTNGALMAVLATVLGGRRAGRAPTPPEEPEAPQRVSEKAETPIPAEEVFGAVATPLDPTTIRQAMEEALEEPPSISEPAPAVDAAAAEAEPPKSPEQAEAGNYRKGHIRLHGLDISIETPKGQVRSGTDESGKPWSVAMPAHYGYIRRSAGADGDQIDLYVGPNLDSPRVFVIDQLDPKTRAHDEHKVFLGFASDWQVSETYDKTFDDGSAGKRLGAITEMSIEEFRDWIRSPRETKKPVAPPKTSNIGVAISVTPKRQRKIVAATRKQLIKEGWPAERIGLEKSGKTWLLSLKNTTEAELLHARTVLETEEHAYQQRSAKAAERARKRAWKGPMDLVTFVRSQGGVQDPGGDLAANDVTNAARRGVEFAGGEVFLGRLVNPEGIYPDEMALRAWEAGYYYDQAERPDMNDFISDLIDTHAGSVRKFTQADEDAIAMLDAEARGQEAVEQGYDITEAPAQEVVEAIERQPETREEIEQAFDLAYYEVEERLAIESEGELADVESRTGEAEDIEAPPFEPVGEVARAPGEGEEGALPGRTVAAPVPAAGEEAQGGVPARATEETGRGEAVIRSWEMSAKQLRELADSQRKYEDEALVRALGEEGAKRFRQLERAANGSPPNRADAAIEDLRKIENSLTPEQERLIYGYGESGHNAETLKATPRVPAPSLSAAHSAW